MKLLICAQVVDQHHPILGFFHQWIEAFSKQFAEVHVICLEKGSCDLPPHVFVYSLGKEAGVSKLTYVWRFYQIFWRVFFRVRVRYVFFHMGAIYNFLAIPFWLWRRVLGTEFFWWKAHGRINRWGRMALWFVDRVYTSTASGFPIKTPKRRIVGQAVDHTLFCQAGEKTDTVLYVGRIAPIKQLEIFVAMAALENNNFSRYEIIGPVTAPGYDDTLRALPGAERVTFMGPKSPTDLVAQYQQATVFLNPSVTHSMDKSVLEAILCGCIPVTGNQAFAELLEPHGLFVSEQTPAAYAAIMQSLASKDLEAIRQALIQTVQSQHSLATFSDRIFNYDKFTEVS